MKKPQTGTATVTKTTVRDSIRRSSPNHALTAEEERALRMRHGVGLDPDSPLAGKGDEHPGAARALLELEARMVNRARKQNITVPATSAPRRADALDSSSRSGYQPLNSRVKAKIVRALRKKS